MATFYIEAVENTNIALVMVGSPTIGTVKYGLNDSTCPNAYTVTTTSTPISLKSVTGRSRVRVQLLAHLIILDSLLPPR